MEKLYTVKFSYKGNTYIIKGIFLTQQAIKQQIITKNIKDLNKQQSFIIQYLDGATNLQQVIKDCEINNRTTFKVNVHKKRKPKNHSNSLQNSQHSSEAFRQSTSHPANIHLENPEPSENRFSLKLSNQRQSLKQDQTNVKTVQNVQRPRKNSEELDLQSQIKNQQPVNQFGIKAFDESRQIIPNEPQLPNFDVSEILQNPPLQLEEKPVISLPVNYSSQGLKQKNSTLETNHSSKEDSLKSSKKCASCSEENILVESICMACLEEKQNKNIQKMSKSLEQTLKIKIKQELEVDIKTKINKIEIQLKKQINQLKIKLNQQQDHILDVTNQNKQLKQSFKIQENKAKSLEVQLNKIKMQFQVYLDKIKVFEKDFQTINEINFELQNSKLIIQDKIDQLTQKQLKSQKKLEQHQQKINKFEPQIRNKNRIQDIPRIAQPKLEFDLQNNKKRYNLVQAVIKQNKPANQNPTKEQLKNLFSNPVFPEGQNSNNQLQKRNLKPIDGLISQIQKTSILKIGQIYEPIISIKNTGSNQWPSQVYIFEKDSKRTSKLASLKPNEECIFKDDTQYKGQRQGQNIQIKYQVYYVDKGEKNYIGNPISIFIKVKKAESDSILDGLKQDQDNDDEENKQDRQKINEQKKQRVEKGQIQMESKKLMQGVQSQLQKLQQFIRMINKKKRELQVGNRTTKDIKMQLQAMGINENNFKESEEQVIEEIIMTLKNVVD